MKKYMTILGCLTFFFIGINSSFAQDEKSVKSDAALKQEIINHDSAKQQTYELHKLLNLDGDQVAKIHDMFLDLDKKQKTMTEEKKLTSKTKNSNEIESEKNKMLKEILTKEQFEIYLKSFREE